MATGIQTGLRRGTRTQPPAQPSTSVWGRLMARWVGLSIQTKVVVVTTLVLTQLAVFGLALHSHRTGFVALYSHKLSEFEVNEISQALWKNQIDNELSPASDGVLVGKRDVLKARSVLQQLGLPRTQSVASETVKPSSLLSADERKALQQKVLEGEIVTILRQVDGVQNAWIKLAVPQRKVFATDEEKPRASVTLALQPGFSLDARTVSSLADQVAFSVPGLLAENVHLCDTDGKPLKAHHGGGGEGMDAHFLMRLAEERALRDKLQHALDITLPGKTKVVVTVDMDFSQAEEKLYTPGSKIDKGMVLSSRQEIAETLKSGAQNKDFVNEKRSENYKVAEHYIHTLRKYGKLERVSATVFADGLSAKEADALKVSAAGALGAKESRGDFIHVDNSPWDHDILADRSWTEVAPQLAVDKADEAQLSYQGLLALLLAQSLFMVGGVAGFLSLRGRPAGRDTTDHLPLCDLGTTGLVDHGRNKLGVTLHDLGGTSAQMTESLEGFVRQRPTQAADLLRSTWLR